MVDAPSLTARPAASPCPIIFYASGPEHTHRHFRPIGLTQKAEQDVDALRWADRPLEDTT